MGRARTNRLLKRVGELRPCADCDQSRGLFLNGKPGQRCHCIRGKLLAKLDEIRARRIERQSELRG